MKALGYHGPGKKSLDERPMPKIVSATDSIVRVTRTTICGTDLHILKGDVPSSEPGRVLGHEGVGVVEQVGSAVQHHYAACRYSQHADADVDRARRSPRSKAPHHAPLRARSRARCVWDLRSCGGHARTEGHFEVS